MDGIGIVGTGDPQACTSSGVGPFEEFCVCFLVVCAAVNSVHKWDATVTCEMS